MPRRKRKGRFRLLNYMRAHLPFASIHPVLKTATAFFVQNVAHHYYVDSDGKTWSLADFPYLAPPTPIMWLEYDATQFWPRDDDRSGIYGFLVTTLDMTRENERDLAQARKGQATGQLFEVADLENVRWISLVSCFLSMFHGHQRVTVPSPVKFAYGIGKDGGIVANGTYPYAAQITLSPGVVSGLDTAARHDEFQKMLDYTVSTYYPCMMALSLMHCKNVEIVEEEDPDAPPPVKPGHKPTRRQREPRVVYRVLKIDSPMKIKKSANTSKTESGRHVALHICRGHFKRFGPEYDRKLLGGKTSGMFWWNMQVRGNSGDGVILKDYDVKG